MSNPLSNYPQILRMLETLSTVELSQLNQDVIDVIKIRRVSDARAIKRLLSVGDTVKVNHPKAGGKTFTVNQINRSKAYLQEAGRIGLISVPISLIEVI
jgi:hypothetical protein